MMDIQSPTCFRTSPATLPRNSSSGSLNLTATVSERTDASKYAFHRSNSYTGNMVVESQAAPNFRPLTPDPLPDKVSRETVLDNLELTGAGRTPVIMPPEGAVTPTEEAGSKKRTLQMSNNEDIMSSCDQNTENVNKLNGQHFMDAIANSNESIDSIDMAQFCSNKRRKLSESVPLKNAEALLDEAFKTGLDKSPPTLSPRTLSDTDFDGTSMGSPSVSISGERRRRKPNIEDIVRRMKEVETDYCSDESENEEVFNEHDVDEVDGDISAMPVLDNQMDSLGHRGRMVELGEVQKLINPNKNFEGEINENNNIIDKIPSDEQDNKENKAYVKDELDRNGIPLPASKPESGNGNSESVIKQVGHITPPHSTGSNWLPGHFNGFPMGFPFQASPPELPFSKFISPYDNKFSSPECEKDYLKCQYCERTFRRQKNLENHIENTHQGKSPQRKKQGETGDMYFKCNHCPYTTKHQSNLYVHLRIHTGERPYICGACGVQYSQSHSLKSHIINKHDGIMSYYIKEKRTRSPRGLGYLATQQIPGESPVFKMPASPMMSQMSPFPGTPNGLHLPQVSMQQSLSSLKHSPQSKLSLPGNPNVSMPNSPLVSPNHLHGGPQQQISPGNQLPSQVSPGQQFPRPPFPPFPHMLPDSLDVAKMMNFPFFAGKPFPGKPSPPFPMNGHGPISPQFNNGLNQPIRPQQPMEHPISQNGGGNHVNAAFPKPHNPLQEIHDNRHSEEDGAIDLRKKSTDEALDLAIPDKTGKCSEDGSKCLNCLHLLKLRMLRLNVVRMLGILVPNLDFEAKGINVEGDSVDDLLRDVIESNIHDEDHSE